MVRHWLAARLVHAPLDPPELLWKTKALEVYGEFAALNFPGI
jgi:hypothetical protein